MSGALQFPTASAVHAKAVADWKSMVVPRIGEEAAERGAVEFRAYVDACNSFDATFQVDAIPQEYQSAIGEAVRHTVEALTVHLHREYVQGVVVRHVIGREGTPAGG